ncbi:MAG TPA: hypothetical protein VFW87_08365 [Pirellulales bacterium]|nr:hypothetical protein [Pirellulales bacterium]
MSRRLQFSLSVVLVVIAAVAVGCAIWIRLPLEIRFAIGAGAAGCLFAAMEALGWLGIPDWIVGVSKSRPRHFIRWNHRLRNLHDDNNHDSSAPP